MKMQALYRMRWTALSFLFLAFLNGHFSYCANMPSASDSTRPNIVLIVADDLGYGDLGCYGSTKIRTPNLDRLAREGTQFTQFLVAQAVCTASRAALMSGCYANRIGMAGALNHTSKTGIHSKEQLLPELLKETGYRTACFGKWHLGTRPSFAPDRNGFDTWFGLPYSNDNGPLHPTVKGIPSLPLIENGKIVALDPDQSQFTRVLTQRAIDFIKQSKTDPFFLYLPHVMPHVPIFASEDFVGKSSSGRYGDVVEELDHYIGELLKAIDEDSKIRENTVVLFLSDNGPFLSYGTHAGSAGLLREGKLTTFEGGVRVPLLVRWPGHVPAGRASNELISGMDLLPTLLAIAGAKQPTSQIDGLDLSQLLLGKLDGPRRTQFFYYSGEELHAVRKDKWKLHLPHEYLTVNGPTRSDGKPANYENMAPLAIEQSGIRGIASRHGYRVEQLPLSLFDLELDPHESTNIAQAHPEIVSELMTLADATRRELGDSLVGKVGAQVREVGREVD
jgi:arylsulfatase A-like enzyme